MSCGDSKSFVLLPAQVLSESGQLDLLMSVDLSGSKEVDITVVVLSVSGSGATLTPVVLTSDVNDGSYFTVLETFNDITAAGAARKYNSAFGRFLSFKWVLAGTTPKFVVTVVGTAKA